MKLVRYYNRIKRFNRETDLWIDREESMIWEEIISKVQNFANKLNNSKRSIYPSIYYQEEIRKIKNYKEIVLDIYSVPLEENK